MPPRAERDGRVGSSGLEWPSVWVGDGAVHKVCAGDSGSRAEFEMLASWITEGGDDGGGSEDQELRRAESSIQRAVVQSCNPEARNAILPGA